MSRRGVVGQSASERERLPGSWRDDDPRTGCLAGKETFRLLSVPLCKLRASTGYDRDVDDADAPGASRELRGGLERPLRRLRPVIADQRLHPLLGQSIPPASASAAPGATDVHAATGQVVTVAAGP